MPIARTELPEQPFAVWLTGLPGSGKSAISRELVSALHGRGIEAAHLESDALRALVTPFASYSEAERDLFYATLAYLGAFLVENGRPVVFDATAHLRAYRDMARRAIPRFAEVYVDTPPGVCSARDPKGLYRAAREGRISSLPGAQARYQEPLAPEVVVSGAGAPGEAARAILKWLEERGWLRGATARAA